MTDKQNITAGTSLMHPAVKFFIFICVIQMASTSAGIPAFVFFAVLFTGLAYYLKISAAQILSKIRPFVFVLLFTFIINIFFGGGVETSAVLTLRFLLIILFSLLLTMSTDNRQLIAVLLYPFKGVHGQNMRIIFMVAMEFIPRFISEAKEIAADIKAMPEFGRKTYKAVLRPELYIKPMAEKMAEMSESVAADVKNGSYGTVTLHRPQMWEYGLALCVFIITVKYAF